MVFFCILFSCGNLKYGNTNFKSANKKLLTDYLSAPDDLKKNQEFLQKLSESSEEEINDIMSTDLDNGKKLIHELTKNLTDNSINILSKLAEKKKADWPGVNQKFAYKTPLQNLADFLKDKTNRHQVKLAKKALPLLIDAGADPSMLDHLYDIEQMMQSLIDDNKNDYLKKLYLNSKKTTVADKNDMMKSFFGASVLNIGTPGDEKIKLVHKLTESLTSDEKIDFFIHRLWPSIEKYANKLSLLMSAFIKQNEIEPTVRKMFNFMKDKYSDLNSKTVKALNEYILDDTVNDYTRKIRKEEVAKGFFNAYLENYNSAMNITNGINRYIINNNLDIKNEISKDYYQSGEKNGTIIDLAMELINDDSKKNSEKYPKDKDIYMRNSKEYIKKLAIFLDDLIPDYQKADYFKNVPKD